MRRVDTEVLLLLILLAGAVILVVFTLAGCAKARPFDCGDNHSPVAKIQVRAS